MRVTKGLFTLQMPIGITCAGAGIAAASVYGLGKSFMGTCVERPDKSLPAGSEEGSLSSEGSRA